MDSVKLYPGDFFVTRNPMSLGRAIMFVEKLWAKDNEAEYSHAGIITDTEGTTLEALWRIKGNELDAYRGKKVLIGRWIGMNGMNFAQGLSAISDDIGRIYPLWRLPLFAIPGAAKWVSSGKFTVCSELVCKFLLGAGFNEVGRWQGQDPEDVSDMIKKWRECEIVYEGVWDA